MSPNNWLGAGPRKPMKRTAIGEKQRTAIQWEKLHATSLEGGDERLGLFYLHRVDWLHVEMPIRDKGTLKEGLPDYLLIGKDWLAFLEIKGRNMITKRMGGMRANQYTFHDKLRAAGAEVWTAYLPDDLQAVNLWLRAKTGIVCEVEA